jgi:glycogen synthase
MQPMKILMTADTVGGVWTYALDLIKSFPIGGCEVLLATMGAQPSASQCREAARIPGLTLCASRYKLEWMEEPWADVDAAGVWLTELAWQFKPTVVHLNNYAHGVLPWQAPVLMVGHSCVLSWWQAVKGEAAPARWATYHRRVAAGLRNADLVVAPSRTMLSALDRYYGPFAAARVIYNARDRSLFATAPKEDLVLSIGRLWDEAKNIQSLGEAAPQLSWPIYVAGEAKHPSGGELQMNTLHSLGYLSQEEVQSWLARASIYALPARYEPFGLSALEAGLSGCALVLGDIPSLREIWGNAAYFVPPDDPNAMAAALEELIQDPAQRLALGRAARKRAERYSPAAVGAAYWQAYQSLAAGGPRTKVRRRHKQAEAGKATAVRNQAARGTLPHEQTPRRQQTPNRV